MAKSFLEQVGERVRGFRKSSRYSIRELAGICGISADSIVRIERGENMLSYCYYKDICEALGYTTADLFRGFKWTYRPLGNREGEYLA